MLPFELIQYDKLIALTSALLTAYPIRDIVGHADIAPNRKTDPGPYFDWKRYRQGFSSDDIRQNAQVDR